ncbi:MAG: hypothetical protein ACLUUF_03800 [Bifidobacterium pullorum]
MAEAKKNAAPAKPTPEEKLAAAEAEVDALVRKVAEGAGGIRKARSAGRSIASWPRPPWPRSTSIWCWRRLAVDETGRGLVEDKATKNIFACEHVTNYMAGQRKPSASSARTTCIGIDEVAEPVGVVAGVTPVTNPTSTAIFKSLDRPEDPLPDRLRLPPGSAEELRRSGAHRA